MNIFTNFIEYGLEIPEIMRMDTTVDLFKDKLNFFDSIICDPPYGYRAAVRESGLKERGKEKTNLLGYYWALCHYFNLGTRSARWPKF